ncbi:MAG TPA: ATP-binding protein [Candidatus Eisenbacteria bacterium]|nr:ATP-binding protein [Candidatus Eisenbacteria bacterium]
MFRKLGPKLILSLTVLIVAISGVSGYLNFRTQKKQLVNTMVLGADELSRSITSATWQFMLDDDRRAAYQIMQTIADKEGVDRIRMFNREGRLVFSTDAREQPHQGLVDLSNDVCTTCHSRGPIIDKPVQASRVRYATSPEGLKTISMVTPIYNEPSCSNASCHAHKASTKVLGVVDVALRLDPVKAQTRSITLQTIVWTLLEVTIGAAFVILFTRRFVGTPIQQLIKATKAVSEMDLDQHIEITERSQELDELVDSFNRMRERLKLAVNELNEMQQTLESKVDERTQQLQTAQRKLVQSDRLASLGQLAASVAHEINNPVSGVLNLSMLLERLMASGNYPPGREAEFRKYLSLISTETARVGRIVSDLLSFSRRSKPQRAPADLNKLIRTTVNLAQHKLKLLSSEIVLDLQETLPQVECDSSQMQQVVLNLVLNGAQAMQPKGGGTLTLRTRLVDQNTNVELSVTDTGEGIAPENISKIFDPFFTTKADGKGVGLGLAVLYGIVKAHDGEVEVTSQRNIGTTFTVTVPLKSRKTDSDLREVQVQTV